MTSTMAKIATIAVEDKSFYSHPGIDVTGFLRALWINIKSGESMAGGSTITQQVARNLFQINYSSTNLDRCTEIHTCHEFNSHQTKKIHHIHKDGFPLQ